MKTPTATTSQVQLRASAAVAAAVLALLALFAGVAGALLWSALPADNQAAVASALAPQRSVLVVIALAIALGAAALAQPLLRRWLIAPRQLHDAAALLVPCVDVMALAATVLVTLALW